MAYFTVTRELVDPDYHDGVVASRKEDLLFQNLVGRIKGQPVDWEQKVQVKAFPKARDAAVAEGVDFDRTQVKEYTDFVLAHVMEIFRSEGYRVTRHREKMPGHNDRRGMTRAQKQVVIVTDKESVAAAIKMEDTSNWVKGCCGSSRIWSVRPLSTTSPPRITRVRCASRRATARSWVTTIAARPRSVTSWRNRSSRRACRCIWVMSGRRSGLYRFRTSSFQRFALPITHFQLQCSVDAKFRLYSAGSTGSRQNISIPAPLSR